MFEKVQGKIYILMNLKKKIKFQEKNFFEFFP